MGGSIRPLYETEEHLEQEGAVIRVVERKLNCKATKISIKYHLDYMLHRGSELFAWAEIRCRTKKYSTMMVSLHKWMSMLDLLDATSKPVLLVVRWPDGIWGFRVRPMEVKIDLMVPNNIRDSQDVEPCVNIPVELFKKISD